ncbi:PD-(D/E)XK nuclease family protein [Leucobacter salsicius]|uniref:PD-(D/E)XK nuclease family protein n=1 Tax=Leucobacter salsicius TaxID=664638 RepID=UPI00034B2D1C|nr:PD-(D/E)XK nuclease family protein [Leucobacter salsicius]
MTLQFFLDPNERHGLGTLVIDALLRNLDEAPLIGSEGTNGERLNAEDVIGSSEWEIGTQVEFIDVYALNRELDLAIVLENKIGHELNNPLKKYAETALSDGVSQVIVAVLAPETRDAPTGLTQWLSASITYEMLSTTVKQAPELLEHLLAPVDIDQRRSLDLLQQFFEARSGGPKVSDLANEEARLTTWRDHLRAHQDALDAFQRAQSDMRKLIQARNKRLDPLIGAWLDEKGFEPGWQAHGGSPDDVWNAYHFPSINWSIELKLTTRPTLPTIYVQVYPERDYKRIEVEDLGLPWSASDKALAEAFAHRVQRLFDEAQSAKDMHPSTEI